MDRKTIDVAKTEAMFGVHREIVIDPLTGDEEVHAYTKRNLQFAKPGPSAIIPEFESHTYFCHTDLSDYECLLKLCEFYSAGNIEIEKLQRWKDQILQMDSEWDVQAVGKLLGLTLGDNIRPAIQPGIEKLHALLQEWIETVQHVDPGVYGDMIDKTRIVLGPQKPGPVAMVEADVPASAKRKQYRHRVLTGGIGKEAKWSKWHDGQPDFERPHCEYEYREI